jgi:hypothetical protein
MWYLASIVLLAFVIHRAIKKGNMTAKSTEKSFWERERAANNVRRKSLDNLNYIDVALDQLPVDVLMDRGDVRECVEQLKALSGQKVVNFTGFTNTDLKLNYGTANISLLTEYDQNYTLLVRTLQKWADLLLKSGYIREGRQVMEYAISIGTDVSKTYYELAMLYLAHGESDRITELMRAAEALHSNSRHFIVKRLEEMVQVENE